MDVSLHHDPFFPDDALEREPWEQQLSGEPVLDYDKGKAQDIIAFLKVAPLDVAQRVLEYESAQKDPRKTVVEAAQARADLLQEEELASTPVRHSENPETVAAVRESLGLPGPDNEKEG